MYAVTAAQMKQLEQNSTHFGMDESQLMENAGIAAADQIDGLIPVKEKHCVVFCGKGNNGGDGFICATRLYRLGAIVEIVLVEGIPEGRLAQDAYRRVLEDGLPILDFTFNRDKVDRLLADVDILVDGIYGTGFRGTLRPEIAEACTAINNAIAAVFALDLPSGVSCDQANGDIDCVRADFTIVFDSYKPAHLLPLPVQPFGHLLLVDIGIPQEARVGISPSFAQVDGPLVFSALPVRRPESHKGDYGRLLLIVGSENYPGAANLAVAGALRSGVGYVQLATVSSVSYLVAGQHSEVVHLPLAANEEGRIAASNLDRLLPWLERADAVAIGSGLGLDEDTKTLVYELLRHATCPIILDADGINAVAENISVLNETNAPIVLTPHLGELARLLNQTPEEIGRNRIDLVGSFARRHGCTVVCKGHETITFPGEGGVFLNTNGNPGMAKAGCGDLLTGLIGGLTAQQILPHLAAACGVWLHGAAGDRAAAKYSQYAMQPTELAACLPEVFLEGER